MLIVNYKNEGSEIENADIKQIDQIIVNYVTIIIIK